MPEIASSIITLTTDFGYKDPFIAEMKGVILSINPQATIIDLTHDIEPFNVVQASFVVGSAYKYFPEGTIHIAVIDPDVGSERRPIIIASSGHLFVGPDNGVFSRVLNAGNAARYVEITSERYFLRKDSPTFQGRDIFAPVAAWLSKGINISDIGSEIAGVKTINIPIVQRIKAGLVGVVLYIDQFGNAITNITKNDLEHFGGNYRVHIKGQELTPFVYYAQSPAGGLGSLVNSSGYLEIFSYRGNASTLFDIGIGDAILVSWKK
ncbi:MAG TPA: SAM-dependent chlorinase/fluorinase [Dissulfurispiraceae bacterium]|nr:SAM-dependent chlorinase/fluorinase [Dissulfurispiraceae bacterium]